MTHEFTPAHFFRQADRSLLKIFFFRRSILWDDAWDALGQTQIDPILAAWRLYAGADGNEQAIAETEAMMLLVWNASTPASTQLIAAEVQSNQVQIEERILNHRSHLNRLLYLWLNDRECFDMVVHCGNAAHIPQYLRHRRAELPRVEIDTDDPATLDALKAAVSNHYWTTQSRGRRAHVEVFLRAGRYVHIFIYPEDYSNNFMGFDDRGAWSLHPQRPAFQVLFIYDPVDGTLETCAPAIKDVQDLFESLFADHVLHQPIDGQQPQRAIYDLQTMLNANLDFTTEAGDNIDAVRVKALDCRVHDGRNHTLGHTEFRVTGGQGAVTINTFVDRHLRQGGLTRANLEVTAAELQVVFRRVGGGRGRATKTIPVRLSRDGCSLRDEPEHLSIHRKLRTWEIERVPTPAIPAAAPAAPSATTVAAAAVPASV